MHQIPPKPSYFRAKVGRRLHRLGAVAIKNSVYVLPMRDQAQEDLQWAAREIASEGGDATLCAANLIEGLRDEQVEALFQSARQADYAELARDARAFSSKLPKKQKPTGESRARIDGEVARLRKRMAELVAIDFFSAPGRESADAAITTLGRRLPEAPKQTEEKVDPATLQRRTWVTRANVHVDRVASAWLIRRFIDDKARFKFVRGHGYKAKNGEVTFDMSEATFTHVGDRCTFEVLVDRFSLREPGLSAIAEIVHDLDVKDGKYGREEAPGVASFIAGLALAHRDDMKRIDVGGLMLDALFEFYRSKKARRGE